MSSFEECLSIKLRSKDRISAIQYDALMEFEFLELFADRSMMVIGTPGIGKSMWLIYLLILLAKADRCVVLDKVQNKDEQGNQKYLFSK